jgi:hypothetical protein
MFGLIGKSYIAKIEHSKGIAIANSLINYIVLLQEFRRTYDSNSSYYNPERIADLERIIGKNKLELKTPHAKKAYELQVRKIKNYAENQSFILVPKVA